MEKKEEIMNNEVLAEETALTPVDDDYEVYDGDEKEGGVNPLLVGAACVTIAAGITAFALRKKISKAIQEHNIRKLESAGFVVSYPEEVVDGEPDVSMDKDEKTE